MADETTTTWANLLREMKGPLVEALRWKTVLLAELKRDTNPRRWQGKQVTIPIILAPQQGTTMITETAALASPLVHDDTQANVTAKIISIAVSFSTQVMEQARADETAWAQVVPLKMRMAEEAFTRVINEQFCGDGTALLASVASGSGSPGLVVPVTAASFNKYQLYAGRIVDVKVRSNGNDPGAGLIRKITSTQPTASPPTVTFDTTSYGGGSGNITFSANEGLYIQGSYGAAFAGLGAITATTGSFQGVNKTSVPSWQGTDASPAAATDPTLSIFDGAERKTYQNSGSLPDWYILDPAVVDKYTQGLTVQARWQGDEVKLQSGFTGVAYRNKALIPEFDMPPSTAYGVSPEDLKIYTLTEGPDWDDRTGSIFQRFSTRSLPVECWLIWMLQLGAHRCNSQVKITSLNQAS